MTQAEVQALISRAVATPDTCLEEILKHVPGGGKLLRPTMVLLCARFGIHDTLEARRVAAAIELIHLASLIHDDVLDGAGIRRNQPALHTLYGTVPAILTGDYLFATAFGLLAKSKKAILYAVTEAIRSMCRGEIQQLTNASPAIDSYYAYIGQKTAALFSTACRCGGIIGRLKRSQQECLARFGWHLGLAYQIVDDYLDLFGTTEKMGKPKRQDLINGIVTLPVLRFLDLVPEAPRWRVRLARGLTFTEMEELVAGARDLDCDVYTAGQAKEQVTLAMEALERMPAGPSRDELAMLATRILDPLREHGLDKITASSNRITVG